MSGMLRALGLFGTLTRRQRPHNLISNSEVILAGIGSTVDSNVIAGPNGLMTADWLREDATNGEHYAQDDTISVVAGMTYTWSFYARGDGSGRFAYVRTALQGTAGILVNLATGAVSTTGPALIVSGAENVGSGWWRCWIRFAASGTGAAVFRIQLSNGTNPMYTGTVGAGMYVVGKQLNQGDLQPYRPTFGAAV